MLPRAEAAEAGAPPLPEVRWLRLRVAGVVVLAGVASGVFIASAMEAAARSLNVVVARNEAMAAPKLEGSTAVPRTEVRVQAGAGVPRVVDRRANGGDDGPFGGGLTGAAGVAAGGGAQEGVKAGGPSSSKQLVGNS